jgi:hypothetical protein
LWTDAFAQELATGSTEAREVLERSLTLLEEEGQVSTRVMCAYTEGVHAKGCKMRS